MNANLLYILFFEIFNLKVSVPYRRSEKIATFEAEKDNAYQTATHIKTVAFALLTSLLQKPCEC